MRIRLSNAFTAVSLLGICLSPHSLYASFIESTIGAAVVDDATATYYNPGALVLLKSTQVIGLGSTGASQSQFSGQLKQIGTSYSQSGMSNSTVNYLLPSFYLGLPVHDKIRAGFAVVANNFNRDIEGTSILRYAQSSNQIQDMDIVPALGFMLNKYLSIGANLNYSRAHFLLEPISGLPALNIPDSQSRNETFANGWGGDIGFLIKPGKSTLIGFNYRSSITYPMKGNSTFNGASKITSTNYHFNYWTPARSVVSISKLITPKIGLIGTAQYIQWSIFKNVIVHDIANRNGILSSASIPYYFHDSWLLTLGANYRLTPKWVVRAATSYTQAPSNGRFQIDTGDGITLGASMGYTLFKNIILDCSYAHAFIQKQDIKVVTALNAINGVNRNAVNALALKLTVNA